MNKVICEFKNKELKLKDVISLPLRFQDRGDGCFDIETADGDTFAKNLDKETAILYCRAFNGYDVGLEHSAFMETELEEQKQQLKTANASADKFEKALHDIYESGCLDANGIKMYQKAFEEHTSGLIFRPHRGGFEDSMNLKVHFKAFSELKQIISQNFIELDESMITTDDLTFEALGLDVRNGWNTYRIALKNHGVLGFTNVSLEDIPLICTESHIENLS